MELYRQGDVLLMRLPARPSSHLWPVAREDGRVVLAHGEVTGHAHAIAAEGVRDFQTPWGVRWIEVETDDAVLRHEEHAAIPLPRGIYRVVQQREYEPQGSRPVAD